MLYNLYFHLPAHQLPALEQRCKSLKINVEPFLSSAVTHCVVLKKRTVCPKFAAKISSVGAKLISLDAVMKWMSDVKAKSPPKIAQTPVKPKIDEPIIIQKPEVTITDVDRLYRPVYQLKDQVNFFPLYPCDGSPFAKNMCPRTEANAGPAISTHRKLFCENCRVTVKDLDEHLASLQHRQYAQKAANFEELDAVIGDLTLAALCGAKRRRVDTEF